MVLNNARYYLSYASGKNGKVLFLVLFVVKLSKKVIVEKIF